MHFIYSNSPFKFQKILVDLLRIQIFVILKNDDTILYVLILRVYYNIIRVKFWYVLVVYSLWFRRSAIVIFWFWIKTQNHGHWFGVFGKFLTISFKWLGANVKFQSKSRFVRKDFLSHRIKVNKWFFLTNWNSPYWTRFFNIWI